MPADKEIFVLRAEKTSLAEVARALGISPFVLAARLLMDEAGIDVPEPYRQQLEDIRTRMLGEGE